MKNKKSAMRVISPDTVSANEYTGSLQKISLDPEEVKKFHDEYVGDD